jgi:hypothetical protein
MPVRALACACGCGVFEVGTSSMLPMDSGITGSIDYLYQDQNRNWSGTARAPAEDNPDRDIRTSVASLALQDVLSQAWSLRADIPYESRHFETTGGASGDDVVDLNYKGPGDMRVQAIYTGLTPGFVTGLTLGVRLPTGSFTRNDAYGDIDRDTEIGSGSTDLLLGAFRRLNFGDFMRLSGFTQVLVDVPVLTQSGYRPGAEVDGAFGAYYSGWKIGGVLVSPDLQLKASVRGSDGGPAASNPVASGFERVLAAPGLELGMNSVRVNADIGLPLYQRFTGNQLAAAVFFRFEVSCAF